MASMVSVEGPLTIRELSELVHIKAPRNAIGGIHIRVAEAIKLLSENKLVERCKTNARKYVLRQIK